jgi:hypothetical protein
MIQDNSTKGPDNRQRGDWLWPGVMAKAHGLKLPRPIMGITTESGNCLSMFQSGSKYYLSNPIEGDI